VDSGKWRVDGGCGRRRPRIGLVWAREKEG